MNNNKTFAAFALAALGLLATGCVSDGYLATYHTGYTSGYVTAPVYTESYTTGYYAPLAVETTIVDVTPPPPPPPPRHVGHRYHEHHASQPAVRHRPAGHSPAVTRKPTKPQPSPRRTATSKPATSRPNPPKAASKPKPTATHPAAPKARPAVPSKGGRSSGGAPGRRKR